MKLVTFQNQSQLQIGILENNRITSLQEIQHDVQNDPLLQKEGDDYSFPLSPDEFYYAGLPAIEAVKKIYDLLKVNGARLQTIEAHHSTLTTPIPNPRKIICVGRNYRAHALEMKSDIPTIPVLFAKYSNSLIGPHQPIVKSPKTNKLDYEVELTVVIGKKASKVKQQDALSYVAGYTIGNDTSARDLQKRTPQWLQGKTLDNSTPIGPWIVTSDEIMNPANLAIKSYVNGEERQSSNTKHFLFDIPYLIEFISDLITLVPGDLIMTGTPDGVGFGMEPQIFLQPGDVVRLEIEKIGWMENKIIDGSD